MELMPWRSSQIIRALKIMFPHVSEEDFRVEKVIVSRWSQDPFAFGSYSYMPVGSSGRDYEVMSEPIQNRIFFAGEATIPEYFGSAHGAFISGKRAAKLILQSLNPSLSPRESTSISPTILPHHHSPTLSQINHPTNFPSSSSSPTAINTPS